MKIIKEKMHINIVYMAVFMIHAGEKEVMSLNLVLSYHTYSRLVL